jgi:hypothetical protein
MKKKSYLCSVITSFFLNLTISATKQCQGFFIVSRAVVSKAVSLLH